MKILSCVALSFIIVIGTAQAIEPGVTRDQAIKNCKEFSKLANGIMQARQAGVQMSSLMEAAAAGDESIRSMAEAIIVEVYSRPRHYTQENIDRAAIDFENDVYATCFSGVSKKFKSEESSTR